MNNSPIDTKSLRVKEAVLGKKLGRNGFNVLISVFILAAIASVGLYATNHQRWAYCLCALAALSLMPAIWWKRYLSILPPSGDSLTDRLSADVLERIHQAGSMTPKELFSALKDHWQTYFFTNHLLISHDSVTQCLESDMASTSRALQIAVQLADQNSSKQIELGYVIAGLLMTAPQINQFLAKTKGKSSDIESLAHWLGRNIKETNLVNKHYGGIGRDWAFGFTPKLDRYGFNVSKMIMNHGAHYGWLTSSSGVIALEAACQNQNHAVALIGPVGIGKTSNVYALAQRLIEGSGSKNMAFHQIVSLNATDIMSRARGPGDLEHIMINLTAEASHAGHIILFLDDAQLYLGSGPGSFDASQILLSVIQSRAAPFILALSPEDYQRLKTNSPSLAGLLTPVVLTEYDEAQVMRILEDTTVGLEHANGQLIAYDALREAYRLSGRYEQEEAYPGKAIKLLELATTHSENKVVTAQSVQRAIEQTKGVKASTAAPIEAEMLVHLEDIIHTRMINQKYAVHVVASALRRARAGVTNPKRPIGSFLFLGPTGVGKTELAKAVAATYFGAESSMIRLDMSEYQQVDDVRRLLSTGQNDSTSLLMAVRNQPFSVVLLDEIEKAHESVLNLLLQLLDEGSLTDIGGRRASFRDCVIIATSNAGADTIRNKISAGESLESFSAEFTDQLISSGQFKPELLNRFDEMVLFRPLAPEELAQVVGLMITELNQSLANQNITIELTAAAVQQIVEKGNDPRLGARPMRRTLQRAVEDTVAQKILTGQVNPGDHLILDVADLLLS